MEFLNPDVYVQDIASGASPITQVSSSIGVLIGTARSGPVGVATLVGSFTEYINVFANGLDTPFMSNSDLTYSVYGFFQNGGKQLYVIRVASNTAVKATKTGTANTQLKLTAKYVGTAGNQIKAVIKKSADWVTTTNEIFDVTISVGTSDSVVVSEVTKTTIANAINANAKASGWVLAELTAALTSITEETIQLAGGVDGISDLADSNYISALDAISVLDDATFVAIPGQTSDAINKAVMAYCDLHQLFPFLDMPLGSTTKQTKDYRKSISANGGILAYPWGNMLDPLTNTQRLTPSSGHAMGVYARTMSNRGVYKAPAGIEATVKGFTSMERQLTSSDIAVLNPVGVVCITSRPNAGIVLWGARGLNPDATMRYVSDVLINYNIKKSLYNGTQFAVFEPNDEKLWSRVRATCQAFLESLRLDGALKGTADQAYYVKVDETNNSDSSISAGYLNIEIGYAPVKPAEFVVIKLAHTLSA